MNPNARQPNESFAAYRARLKAMHASEKRARQGRPLWNVQERGTYVRAIHGPLESA